MPPASNASENTTLKEGIMGFESCIRRHLCRNLQIMQNRTI